MMTLEEAPIRTEFLFFVAGAVCYSLGAQLLLNKSDTWYFGVYFVILTAYFIIDPFHTREDDVH